MLSLQTRKPLPPWPFQMRAIVDAARFCPGDEPQWRSLLFKEIQAQKSRFSSKFSGESLTNRKTWQSLQSRVPRQPTREENRASLDIGEHYSSSTNEQVNYIDMLLPIVDKVPILSYFTDCKIIFSFDSIQ